MERPTLVRRVAGYAADDETQRRRAAYEGVGRNVQIRFIGLDVHAGTIADAVAEPGGEVRSHGVIPNRLESVRKLIHKLGSPDTLRACFEAGPTGYVHYWQLTQLGVPCEVIAPSLVPIRPIPTAEEVDSLRSVLEFEWDARKARANLTTHGVTFAEACTVF